MRARCDKLRSNFRPILAHMEGKSVKNSANRNPEASGTQESSGGGANSNARPPINPVYCAAQEVWEDFGAHLRGLLAGAVCVVSERTLGSAAQNALAASMERLGYGQRAITYLVLRADEPGAFSGAKDAGNASGAGPSDANNAGNASGAGPSDANNASNASDAGNASAKTPTQLTRENVFKIIEGIDPYAVITADATSMNVLSHAYGAEFSSVTPARLSGRCAVGFVNFEAMLEDPAKKRAAWEHLKKLGEAPKPQ